MSGYEGEGSSTSKRTRGLTLSISDYAEIIYVVSKDEESKLQTAATYYYTERCTVYWLLGWDWCAGSVSGF